MHPSDTDPRTAFWQAVSERLPSLAALPARERVEALNELLQPLFPELACEVAGEPPAFKLVLTAHGAKEHFEDLMALAGASPRLPGVEVEAFRRRAGEGFGMRMNDFELASADLRVRHAPCDGLVALEIAFARPIPMDMRDHARHMSFIMLDHILGEYDFAVKVGPVDFVDADEESGFDGVPLDDFAPVFDAFWRDELGHSGVFPSGEHAWTGLRATRETGEGDEIEMIVMRNDSANALLGRADLGHRLSAAIPVASGEELAQARDYEDRLSALLQTHEAGCCTHVELAEGVRTVHYQVADAAAAIAHAQSVQEALDLPVTLGLDFEPDWAAYRRWLD